jgi:ADP-ribose pyrophosphatase
MVGLIKLFCGKKESFTDNYFSIIIVLAMNTRAIFSFNFTNNSLLMSQSNPPLVLPTLIDRKLVFEESIVKIRRDKLQIDQEPPYDYFSLLTPPFAVCILAITPEGAYVLNEEYRHPTGRVILGCPGGFIDPGEDSLAAARRELLEETGFQADSFTLIGSAFPYAGFSGQKTIYIRALGATFASQPHPEASEVINPILLIPDALEQEIAAGKELDGTLCTALFFHHYHPNN